VFINPENLIRFPGFFFAFCPMLPKSIH
jgi:hypothetical protein